MTHKKRLIPIVAALLVGGGYPLVAYVASTDVVAEVNGTKITKQMVEQFRSEAGKQGRGVGTSDQAILEELVSQELIYQDAEKKGIENSTQFQEQMQRLRRNLLIATALSDYLDEHPVSDEEVEKFYDNLAERMKDKEYHARHILVKTEEEANDIIGALNEGGDFAELAKEKSTGPTGKKGGDLGWFRSGKMVKPFSDATAKLSKGEYTKQPVKTQFGWHVILLEDVRDVQPPPLAQIKPRIVQALEQEKVREYVAALRAEGQVSVEE
jgi:peptidyl-prolyl cis-trans isomerase C